MSQQERSYTILGSLRLPHPSDSNLTKEHKNLALSLQKDLQMLQNRDLRELNRPLQSLNTAYDRFKLKELDSWRSVGQRPRPQETLVRPSGLLDAPLAHHLHQPSLRTLSPLDDSETADPTNGCIAMVMGNLYTSETLVFDHLHRRSESSEGLRTLPEPVLNCHETYTRDICESMLAKVEFLHGRKVHNRILKMPGNANKFTALPLWGPFDGVTLFLAHESNYRNADLGHKFRRICLFVLHPQVFFYERKGSGIGELQDRIHIAAARMTDMPVREFYFREKQWKKLSINTFRAMVTKELASFLKQHSESGVDAVQVVKTKHKAEGIDHRVSEASQGSVYPSKPSKRKRSTGEDFSDSAVSQKARSIATLAKGKKKTAVPRKNPRQGRNRTARARAIQRFQDLISVANPAVELPFTLNSTSVLEEAGREGLSINSDMILSSSAPKDNAVTESKEGQWMAQRGGNSNLIQIKAKELLTDDIPRTGSNLKAPTKTVKAKTIDSETETKTSSLLDLRPHDKHEPITSPVSSKEVAVDERTAQGDFLLHPSQLRPQAEEEYSIRDLNFVNVDDMDCKTRHDRLRTLNLIVSRGDRLTEIEESQLAELKAKGTRVHGRDLSKMGVASMDNVTRKTRRCVLRKKIDRHDVLNEAEMKQLTDFGMLLS
ncbi:uncharacterized protein PV07_08775 [Cladophialophora immunda]|uniref:Uncharacterized protein n=1 Tax=Cladophialophora immunda TaxID=569365 RepID=A0A0D2CPV7_9EURO|nr:uncharacterized protein PV07_08775 [Cladophialophora immunda]KIW25609.1 hypothetical protein PV07_08775 [Cladophialophora immunda]